MVQVNDLPSQPEEEQPYQQQKPTLLSKYNIPIQHLDFSYVETCNNSKELEKIIEILRSGEEGYFPDLTKSAEKRLVELKPTSKFLRVETPVLTKNNLSNAEWNDLTKDLDNWLYTVSKNDEELECRRTRFNPSMPEVRQMKQVEQTKIQKNPRIASMDYHSWDKYDVDTEITKIEVKEEQLKEEGKKIEKPKKAKTVRFTEFSTEAERLYEANCEKERGNEYFKVGEYSEALDCYTCSIQCKPSAVGYTNRAVTYIKLKKFTEAITDCKLALKFEPKNFKAHLRIAQSSEALKQYDEALKNVEAAIKIDPNNAMAQELATKIRKLMGKTSSTMRLTIEDVEEVQLKSILKERMNYEVISIPGSSKMQPPYYKLVKSGDQEAIYREKRKIYSRPRILHLTTIDAGSDDDNDCCENHIPGSGKETAHNTSPQDDPVTQEVPKQPNIIKTPAEKDKGGGGDSFKPPEICPVAVTTPYSFLMTWRAAGTGPPYDQHAEILRNLNVDELVESIGSNLDNNMLSGMLNCLEQHFTVVSELNCVHSILANLTRCARFEILALFVSESDCKCLTRMFEFLEQHGKNVSNDLKLSYRLFSCEE